MKKKQEPRGKSLADGVEAMAEQFKPPFRGEIYEFFKDVPMGRGFANKGKVFDIQTACYLKEPMREMRIRPYGKFVLMAAVQMLKTFGGIECPAGYYIANDPGDMTVFLTGDDSAFDQAKARLMPLIKSNPAIAKIIDEVTSASSDGRFNIATQGFYLPGMVLRVWPLNETTTQRITLRYVLISDAFLSKRTGLIKQALARLTQHDTPILRDYKAIIESQGGEEGDDFDAEWNSTDKRLIHVVCPLCRTAQCLDWHKERGEDFIPVPPTIIPSLDHAAWMEHNRKLLIAPDRKHAGMKRGDNAKMPDGEYDQRAVSANTFYECFYCGGAWKDDEKTRRLLDESSHYRPSNTMALPHDIGFWWPAWAGQRIAWGKIMLEYLQAKQSASVGNYQLIQQWHQKREARPWSPKMTRTVIEIAPGSYDPAKKSPDEPLIPNEHSRNMAVDCQQDQEHFERTGQSIPGYFWYEAVVVDKFGNSQQIARGHARSWAEWIAVQEKWKIVNDRVVIDVSHWPELIMQQTAAHRKSFKVEKPLPPFFIKERAVTWILLQGSDDKSFGSHKDGKVKPWAAPQAISVVVFDETGRRTMVTLKKVRWSNYAFKMQLDAIRSGAPGMPKKEVLSRDKLDEHTKEMETGFRAYEKQMENEVVGEFRGRERYEQLRPDVHYRDTGCMLLWRQAQDGLIGHLPEMPEDGENKAQ